LGRDAEQQAEASRGPADAERIRRDAESILLRAKKQLKAAAHSDEAAPGAEGVEGAEGAADEKAGGKK